MISKEEESFPRGGKRPKVKTADKRPRNEDNLFSASAPKAKKPKKSKKSSEKPVTEESFFSNLNIKGTLSYKKLQEGMVVLSCVRSITDFSIQVELPGLTFGYVNITRISDSFTKLLNEKLVTNDGESEIVLKNIFRVGQYMPVKVVEISSKEQGVHVECSINPRDIFSGKSHVWFKKHMLVWCSIHSELDHGFEVSVGVNNCRVFLPSKNIDEGRKFAIGEPFWGVIHKCESTNVATTLRLSSKSEHIQTVKTETLNSLDDLLPGMQVDFIVDKITSGGIQGKFLNNYFGHIDYTQLKNASDELSNYQEDTILQAYVLFIETGTKVTYLSLRNIDYVSASPVNIGDVIQAKVVSKGYHGIYLKSKTEGKYFVTNKRLVASLPQKPNMNIQETINEKFKIGTTHLIRVLDYNHMSRLYICTTEQDLVKEKHFSASDLKPGQLLSVKIVSIKDGGLVVKAGHTTGFVPNLFITNAQYSDNIKKKFKENSKVEARVLYIDGNDVILTLKQSQIVSDLCLISLEQAKRGDCYPGVVVHAKAEGATVVFYNKVKGWINKKRFNDVGGGVVDPRKYFFTGQVMNFWILGTREDKVLLSLNQPKEFKPLKDVKLYIGQKVCGTVCAIHKDSVDIKNEKGLRIGRIPSIHLSPSLSLCSTYLKTLKVGDEISDLICIDNTSSPNQLSRREGLCKSSKIKIKKISHLRKGNLIRCFYLAKAKTGIYVKPLIKDYSDQILIETKNIIGNGESMPNFIPEQSFTAKILSIDQKTKYIKLTLKLGAVFSFKVEVTFNQFSLYLKDLLYLRKFGQENNWKLCQYQPGERVSCKIEQLGEEGGCLVTLPNGVQGLVPARLCPDNLESGQEVKGIFLAENFEENFVEVCLRNDLVQRVNVCQDGKITTKNLQAVLAEKLLIKNDYILGVLKPHNCNRQLIYIPTSLHQNDFTSCKSYYELCRVKLCICGKVEDLLLGMSKKLFLYMEQKSARLSEKKSKKKKNKKGKDIKNNKKRLTNSINSETQTKAEEKSIEGRDSGAESESDSFDEDDNLENFKHESEESGNENIEEESDLETETSNTTTQIIDHTDDDDEMSENETVETREGSNINNSTTTPKLSGVSSFFSPAVEEKSESSSDEEDTDVVVKKKKKMTPKERAEQLRLEEERISKIEKELADSNKNPENAEQFDRLLLANPNSSELWTKYMSFHLAATEIDKARTVAKRALDTIDITLSEERLNIWIALLNLENILGTKESFNKTFEDALKYNDSLEIHLKAIQLLAESGKLTEMEEKVKKVRSKHKQEPKMWLEVAKTYYMLKKFQEARNLKDASLKSIQNKKTQLELIIRFAIMEFKYGEEEQGAAIFETLLSSDPKKVTIWTIYVDQLVKKGRIEQARRVLERAVAMFLPFKSTKSLYLKFKMFEEQHGTPESLEAVKQSAKAYFEKMSKKLD